MTSSACTSRSSFTTSVASGSVGLAAADGACRRRPRGAEEEVPVGGPGSGAERKIQIESTYGAEDALKVIELSAADYRKKFPETFAK